jgi:biopolymer transport protein ExbB
MNSTEPISTNPWWDYLQHVSPVVTAVLWILVGLSLLTWFLIVYKALEFWHARRADKSFAQHFWSSKTVPEAKTGIPAKAKGPCSELTESGWRASERFREWLDGSNGAGDLGETVTRALRQSIQDRTTRLEAGLGVLATIGNTAPFIGLFGTVVGIMSALKDISQTGAAGLDVVAGPIGEALIATAAGLACAIPAVVAYNGFVRRLRVLTNGMNGFAQDLLGRVLAERRDLVRPASRIER